MRWFLLLLVVVSLGAWWHGRTPRPEQVAITEAAPASQVAVAATPAPAVAAAAPAHQASWPKRQINQAQGALDAVKKQRDEL